MYSKSNADRVAAAVFLIGLGLLFSPLAGIVGGFWPGILFVIGAAVIARGIAEEQSWVGASSGLALMGLGIIFLIGFNLPLLLIVIGLILLFRHSFNAPMFGSHQGWSNNGYDEKPKHDGFV